MARKSAKKATSSGPSARKANKKAAKAKETAPAAKPARKTAKKTAKKATKRNATSSRAVEPDRDAPLAAEDTSAAEATPTGNTPRKRRAKAPSYASAESMAKQQRSISVSEFFAKNRHLLGFDNPRKALLTTVKEAVDNALDACEEAGILPIIEIAIEQVAETHFRVVVQDNGPGIVKKQIPSIFGRLLYGSKFHRLRMSRGQQGIGISAAGMYGLLTTGQPISITSRTSKRQPAHHYQLQIDTRRNKPTIMKDEVVEDWHQEHGTRVEIELEARYLRGRQSVDDYLQQTAIANPHVTLVYHAPDGREERYDASVQELPPIPREVRPHPHGVELGVMIKMMQDTKARTVQQFLTSEFSRVSPRVAREVIEKAGLTQRSNPRRLKADAAKAIYEAIQDIRILAPATDCVVPIGEDQLLAGLRQVVDATFYTATTRRPSVYRGNPFIIEVALAYGKPDGPHGRKDGEKVLPGGKTDEDDSQLAKLIRFANRVPLQYQQSACATCKAVIGMNWKGYGLTQSRGALPSGPLTVVVHMASVWVPFTSESKEAIASYPEILKEIRLALQDCGRKLNTHIRRVVRERQELKKRSYIQKYIPAIGEALRDILSLKDSQVDKVCEDLKTVLERSRKL